MHIVDIVILSQRFTEDARYVEGRVQFMIATGSIGARRLTLSCMAPLNAGTHPETLLVADAIRQVRRMPEIRSGQHTLTFARGLKPQEIDQAA